MGKNEVIEGYDAIFVGAGRLGCGSALVPGRAGVFTTEGKKS
jgi:hypothetical protein